tara:strand:- start:275 stop:502 length:228 start_codon:yes stop_codon:yes gene_type:complete
MTKEEERRLKRLKNREYRQKYYRKNKERIQKYQRDYYRSRKDRSGESVRKYNTTWKGVKSNEVIIKRGEFVVSFE